MISYCDIVTMVKICGLTSQADADLCLRFEAGLVGFVFHQKSPRYITPEKAETINTGEAMRVGVFVDQSPQEIRDIMRRARLHIAQLHGDQDQAFCQELGKPRVMRVFWPQRYETRQDLEKDLELYAPCMRFALFDAGTAGGGHGTPFDFNFLKGLNSPKSWFIAGGLGPDNIKLALGACNPCGIDLNSGVESAPGVKDQQLMARAFQQLCEYDSAVRGK